jgi:hypothetical protein
MILRLPRIAVLILIALALFVTPVFAADLPDVPQCRGGVLTQEVIDVVKAAEKDPRKALEAKRRDKANKSNAMTKASVDCASRLWQALHPAPPKMSWSQRRAAARQARAAEKAREKNQASGNPRLSTALSPAGRRALSHEERERLERQERMERNSAPVIYAGAPVDLRPVAAVYSVPLGKVHPIPPRKRGEDDDGEGHPEPVRPPPPVDIGAPEGFRQRIVGPITSAPNATGVSFDGIGVGLGAFNPASNPPDVNGHVGATQYVQWNNTSFAIFSKTGTLLYGPAAGNTLFQSLGGVCAAQNDGDPVVNYDLLAGRWVLSQFVVQASPGFSHQCFAVSATDDALGSYYLYDFVTDATNFVDYPHVGVWPDGYYMTTHVFNSSGTAFLAGRVHVFEREKMILGQPARQLQKDLRTDGGSPQYGFLPADLDSHIPPPAGEASFVLGPNALFTNQTDSTRVAVTWGVTPTITFTETTIATVGIGSAPCVNNTAAQDNRDCVPQPSPAVGADYLDNISDHFMYRLAYRNFGGSPVQESLVVSGPTNGSVTVPAHGAVKWIEFRNAGSSTSTPTVFQSGTFDPDSAYRWLPSIAMDKDSNIALGYSKSSTSIKPGIYITGRLGTDTINTMGGEATVQAGVGSQTSGAGNRWGDYSALTLDPVDQCTFWYTNEYLKTNGAFNWSTRIASFRFPSCTDAPAWGTISGTITSCATGTPISGALVTLSNGFAATSNASGNYSILVPAGTYTASAAAPARNCTSGSPSTVSVTSNSGGTTTQNFCMSGTSNLQSNGIVIDDSSPGNNNGVVNRDECVKLNLPIKNNGCGNETAISATLTTGTANVTVTQGTSAYPDLAVDASAANVTPFQFQTSSSFVCGTSINFTLTVVYASGNKVLNVSVPTCAGANQTIPSSSLTAADLTQSDRIGRDGLPSTCAGKTSPGGGFAGTKFYKTFTFTNSSSAARCFTVNITAALGGAGDIESVAYSPTYNPASISTNYKGDTGIVGLGTTVGSASYAFTIPASTNFVVVVNTTGTTTSSVFSGTVSGFIDNAAGPGACSPCTPPPTPTVTPGGPTTFCAGGSVTLTSSSATGNQWYNGLTLLPGQTNQTYVATTSGNYNVVVTTGGCSSAPSASTTVTVNSTPTPTVTPGGPTTFCAGGSVTLTSSSATGNQWYNGLTLLPSQTNQTYVATTSGNYNVVVTANGCPSTPSASTTVTVNPIPPTPTITGGITFCEGGSVNLTSSSATGNQWSRNGTPLGGETGQVLVVTQAGNYTVTVTTNGCTSAPSAPKVVTSLPKPDATITVVSPMFSGAESTASVNVACDGATFSWSLSGSGGTITGGNGTPMITFTAGAPGTLVITVTVTAANGCSDTKSVNVTVQTAAFGPPPAFRASGAGTTTATLTWGAVQLADHYEIHRSTNNGTYTLRGTSPTPNFSDSGLTPSTTYYYKVRTIKADTTASSFSAIDLATTLVFTDDPLTTCATVKAVHITQLRTAVNLARASLSLAPFTFTDPGLASGTLIKGVHITELRTALAPVLTAIGVTTSYTDPTITPNAVIFKGAHIRELRDLVR